MKSQKRKQRAYFLALKALLSPLSTRKKRWRNCDLNTFPRWNLTGLDQYFHISKLYCFQQNKVTSLKYMELSTFKCYGSEMWLYHSSIHHDHPSASIFLICSYLQWTAVKNSRVPLLLFSANSWLRYLEAILSLSCYWLVLWCRQYTHPCINCKRD